MSRKVFFFARDVSNFFNSKVINYMSTCNLSNYIKSKLNKINQNKNSQHLLKPLRIPARLLSFMNKAFPIQGSCSVAKVSQVICKSEAISIDK